MQENVLHLETPGGKVYVHTWFILLLQHLTLAPSLVQDGKMDLIATAIQATPVLRDLTPAMQTDKVKRSNKVTDLSRCATGKMVKSFEQEHLTLVPWTYTVKAGTEQAQANLEYAQLVERYLNLIRTVCRSERQGRRSKSMTQYSRSTTRFG